MTSRAMTPSTPFSWAAWMPARACRRTPAHAAVKGSTPRESTAARTPLRTSPVPAVASAPVAPGLTATRPPGVGHERVVALEHDDRLRLRRGGARVLEAAGRDGGRVDLEQARRARPRAA